MIQWLKALIRRLRRWIAPDSVFYIGGSDTLPPPLPREEEAELLERMMAGEENVRSILIERNLRLVVYIAKRFVKVSFNILLSLSDFFIVV